MTEIPAGAQISEDGSYWWDGSAWQLVNPNAAGAPQAAEATPAAAGEEVATADRGKLEHQWGASVLDVVDVPEMQADDAAESQA